MAVTNRGQTEPNTRGIRASFQVRLKTESQLTSSGGQERASSWLLAALLPAASLPAARISNGPKVKGMHCIQGGTHA